MSTHEQGFLIDCEISMRDGDKALFRDYLDSGVRCFLKGYRIEPKENHQAGQDRAVGELREALTWILPMAKGYAHEHPVGRNASLVQHAEELLVRHLSHEDEQIK